MRSIFTVDDKTRIKNDIEEKYHKVAICPAKQFNYPTGKVALEKLGYDLEILETLGKVVSDSYCGTGNPFSMETVDMGEKVLDFGCGAGVDAIYASRLVGEKGRVVGVDIVQDMLDKAIKNSKTLGIDNIEFRLSKGETLEFEDKSFDTIISNSVINLVPEKKVLFREIYRCLKPGGKLLLVDQVFKGEEIKEHHLRVNSWFQ